MWVIISNWFLRQHFDNVNTLLTQGLKWGRNAVHDNWHKTGSQYKEVLACQFGRRHVLGKSKCQVLHHTKVSTMIGNKYLNKDHLLRYWSCAERECGEKEHEIYFLFHANRYIQQWQREITEHLLWQKVGYYCKNELIMIIAVSIMR